MMLMLKFKRLAISISSNMIMRMQRRNKQFNRRDKETRREEEKGGERSNDHNAGTGDDGRGRKSQDAEIDEKEEGTTKSINQHLGSSTLKEEKTAFTSSPEKQDLNEVTSSLIQSENRLQETGGSRKTDQQQDQEKKSAAAGATAASSSAAVKAPSISKAPAAPASGGSGRKHHQLPPAKSLILSAPVIINLNPVSFMKSLRKEEKDHDNADAVIEGSGNQHQQPQHDHKYAKMEQTVQLERQQQLQHPPRQTTRQSQADQQTGPQTSSSSSTDQNSDLHSNDHNVRRIIMPACYTDDENVDEEEEDEWHEMQSHDDLNFDHHPLALARFASSPHYLQERHQQTA